MKEIKIKTLPFVLRYEVACFINNYFLQIYQVILGLLDKDNPNSETRIFFFLIDRHLIYYLSYVQIQSILFMHYSRQTCLLFMKTSTYIIQGIILNY
jgi:hypothetical protein